MIARRVLSSLPLAMRRPYPNVRPGEFLPGTNQARETQQAVLSATPLDYLLQHPLTRTWFTKLERNAVTSTEVFDTAINVGDGYEGVIQRMVIFGKALGQGPNSGITWRLLIDRANPFQSQFEYGAGAATATILPQGYFDYLHEGDGLGQSWGTLLLWIPENGIVEVAMINNGGSSDPMGWMLWGAYWPTTVREGFTWDKWGGKK